ncbi:MAG: M3 family metallopeptidase, partial [Planctomycetes bacterium]|nr:M3 family metallopeptidase [Planctomycetota bacterium]
MSNPLLETGVVPAFDRIQASEVESGMDQILQESEQQLTALEALVDITWGTFIPALQQIEQRLNHTWGAVSHLLAVNNSEELRAAHEAVQPKIVALSMRIAQSSQIYAAFCQLRDADEWSTFDDAQQRIVLNAIRDAELSGINLVGENKERFNAIQLELAELQTSFSNNVLDATKGFALDIEDVKEVAGLPPSALALAAQAAVASGKEHATPEKGPWRITLDYPSFVPFLEYAENRSLRERMYKAFISRAASDDCDNQPNVKKILLLRKELAALLGYEHFAAMSLASKMADSPEAVYELLDELHQVSHPVAQKEHQELIAFALANGVDYEIRQWDIAFWSKRQQEVKYEFNDEDLRPYFSLPKVLDGLFALAQRLFDVRIEAADGEASVWDPAVRFFKIFNSDDNHCASFYLDPYSRPENKRGGAWMNDCVGRNRHSDGVVTLPIAHLVCNSTPPVGDKPSLMIFREVETLFHEFGHGLQHMLTTIDHAMAAGINNVEWDAVELPSQFMENWCYDKNCVDGFARHFESGDCIPGELFDKISAARNYRAASAMQRQISLSETDMFLYHSFDPADDAFMLQQE